MKNSQNNNIILGFSFLVLYIWFQLMQRIDHLLLIMVKVYQPICMRSNFNFLTRNKLFSNDLSLTCS